MNNEHHLKRKQSTTKTPTQKKQGKDQRKRISHNNVNMDETINKSHNKYGPETQNKHTNTIPKKVNNKLKSIPLHK